MPALPLACGRAGHLVQPERPRRGEQRHATHHGTDVAMVRQDTHTAVRSCAVNTRRSCTLARAAERRHGNALPPGEVVKMRARTRFDGTGFGLRAWDVGLELFHGRLRVEQ